MADQSRYAQNDQQAYLDFIPILSEFESLQASHSYVTKIFFHLSEYKFNQIKVPFESLNINEPELDTFTVSMWVTVENKKISFQINKLQNLYFCNFRKRFSFFPSWVKYNQQANDNRNNKQELTICQFCVTIYYLFSNIVFSRTRKGKFETIYSQFKLKPSTQYFIAVAKCTFANVSEINMYINGFPETQITMQTQFDVLSGNFYFGSELNMSAFTGTVNDAIFFPKQLCLEEITSVYEKKIENQFQQMQASQNLKSSTIPQHNAQMQYSMLMNKANATHFNGLTQEELQLLDQTSQMLTVELNQVQKFNILVEAIREVIENTKGLEQKCFYLAQNFERAFLTLQMFSPTIQSGVASSLPFNCLHKELAEQQGELPYPVYVIELDRFLKAMEVIGCQIVEKEFIEMARACKALKRTEKFGRYIVYNRLLLCLRNAVMSREEIMELRKQYKTNPLQTEEEMHMSPEQQERIEQAKAIGPIALGYFASENLVAGFDTLNGFKDKNAVIEYRPISITYSVLREILVPFKIEFSFRPFIDRESSLEDGEVQQCFYLNEQLRAPNTVSPDQLEQFHVEFAAEEVIKEMILKFEKEKKILLAIDFVMSSSGTNTLRLVEETLFNESEFFAINLNFNEDEFVSSFYGSCVTIEIARLNQTIRYLGGIGGYVVKDAYYQEFQRKLQIQRDEENNIEELPELPENWNAGRFQIVINHCTNCLAHQITTWHEEADFAEKFNEIGQYLKDLFPNLEIIGNYDSPLKRIAHFEAYIRGVGGYQDRDEQGRVMLYEKKKDLKLFLDKFDTEMLYLYDNLILLISQHEDSMELERMQDLFFKRFGALLPKKWEEAHDHPMNIPDKIQKKENIVMTIPNGTVMVCRHWGCGQTYQYEESPNAKESICRYHPGVYQFGSIQGLWPESWTCCREPWEKEGCHLGKHDGITQSRYTQLCLNRGEPNPLTQRPDSVCGQVFSEHNPSECKFHIGYIIFSFGEQKWSCCGQPIGCEPCNTTEHKVAKWPDEEAKLYFVQKDLLNPGLDMTRKVKQLPFSKTAVSTGYYRSTVPYNIVESKEKTRMKKLQDTENEVRYCLNWGCETEYKQFDNKKKKMCRCHPGIWDFGHTGITISQAKQVYNDNSKEILWKPHWTCCRKEWTEKGCMKTRHRGPLISEMTPQTHPYRWPSEHAQKYFKKVPSMFWKTKLESEGMEDPEKFVKMWKKCVKDLGSGGEISISRLTELLDKFKLHLYVNSENLAYHFKFLDVMNGIAEQQLENANGNIDKDKFFKWWFDDLDKIRPVKQEENEQIE